MKTKSKINTSKTPTSTKAQSKFENRDKHFQVDFRQFWLVIFSILVNPLAFDMFYWSGESIVMWISDLYQISTQHGYNYVNIMNTAYIFGVFVSQLVWSTVFSYKYRRMPFVTGMLIIMFASLMGVISENWLSQIFTRGLIGAGVACEITAATILIADWYSYSTKKLNYGYSIITVASFLGSLCAPLLAIFLIDIYGSWKIIYLLLAGFSAIMIAGIYFLVDKTRVQPPSTDLSSRILSYNLIYNISLNAKMLQQIVLNGLCFGNMTIYYTSAVFIFIHTLQIPSQMFGILTTINVMGAILGSVINTYCKSDRDLRQMLYGTIYVSLVVVVTMMAAYYLKLLTLWPMELLLFVLSVCSGIIIANSTSGFILASKEYISISIGLYNIFRFGFSLLASAILIPVTAVFKLEGILYLVLLLIILQIITIRIPIRK